MLSQPPQLATQVVAVPAAVSRPDARPAPWPGRTCGAVTVSGAVAVSLAEHLHLGVGLGKVDDDVVELLDELLDVLRLELGEVDRHP